MHPRTTARSTQRVLIMPEHANCCHSNGRQQPGDYISHAVTTAAAVGKAARCFAQPCALGPQPVSARDGRLLSDLRRASTIYREDTGIHSCGSARPPALPAWNST